MNSLNFILDIDKASVKSRNLSQVDAIIKLLQPMAGMTNQSITIAFQYNDVPEEVFVIPEIRAWVRKLFRKYPHFLYYAENDKFDTDKILLLCLCETVSVSFVGENISQDEYIQKYGKLDYVTTHTETKNLHKILAHYLLEVDRYGKRIGQSAQASKIVSMYLDRWRDLLKPV